ncbi:MAG: hypothetical protein JWQ01_3939, partial [Massilia sp.]|nr:hypothetical protein [Massilia sp.]
MLTAFGASAFLIGSVAAQIIADPRAPGQQRPTILNTANGVLQVNVQTPSAAGVSRNTYVQFDVPASGAILNNSRVDAQTQLGGWVQANPWLANGGARVILNEVNSSDPSHLRGYVEVAGQRAEVIVANPAGIAVDGGGFINVSRATLTTGTAEMTGAALDGYSVKRGEVSIDGVGLDASHTDYTALIARSVAVNASLWANQLSVTTGVNQVSADGTAPTAQTAPGTAPTYGIDVGRLGGMYANKIFLVDTEAGVGVRNAGAIGAAAGDLIVTSDGRLENSGTLLSTQQLDLRVRSASNSGTVSGDGGVTLTAATLQNSGQIHSASQAILTLQGAADNSHGTIEARRIDLTSASGAILNRQGKIVQSGGTGLDIGADSLFNAAGGQIGFPVAVADGNASGTPPSTSDGSSPLPNGQLRAAQTIDNLGGQIAAGGLVSLNVSALDNSGGQLRLPSLNFDGSAFGNRGGTLEVLHDFNAHASNFDNAGGKLLIGEHFNASLGQFNNTAGLLQAGAWRIAVTLGLDNSGGVLRHLGTENAILDVGAQLNNEKGTLESVGSMQLSAGAVAGSGSRLTTLGDLQLNSGATSALGANWNIARSATIRTGTLDTSGIISAGKDLNVTSAALNSQAGLLYGASSVAVRADGALLNHDGGQIYSGGALSLIGQSLGNHGGSVKATGPALFSFGAGVDNAAGILQSATDMTLTAGGVLTNDLGTMEVTSARGKLGVNAQSISNGGGRIVNFGNGATSVSAQSYITNNGLITGNGELSVSADTLQNDAGGVLSSGKDMALAVRHQLDNAGEMSSAGALVSAQSGAVFNNRGNIVAAGQAAIAAASINNSGGRIATVKGSGGGVVLAAQRLSNNAGAVMADGNAIFNVGGGLDNRGGLLQAGKDLRISAGALDNSHAVIETLAPTSGLTIQARSIANEAGRIVNVGVGNTDVMSDGVLSNGGLIAGAGNLDVSAQVLQNSGAGKIDAGGQLLLTVQQQLANSGAISSQGALDIAGGALALTNRGLIASKGNASISAGQIDNDHGQIVTTKGSGADLVIHAVDLHNLGGSVLADGKAVIVNAGGLNNDGGTIQSLGDLQLTAGATLSNNAGVIEAINPAASMTLRGQSIVNDAAGRIVNAGNGPTVLTSGAALVNSGLIAGNGNLELAAATLNNKAAGSISSGAALGLAVRQQLENAGIISSKGILTLNEAASSVKNSGAMGAGGAITLAAANLVNDGGQIATVRNSGAGVTFHGDSVSNRGGTILADGNLAMGIAGALENGYGTLQAGKDLQIVAGGVLGNNAGVIETAGAASTLTVQAHSIDNASGHITNVGNGDSALTSTDTITNNGSIATGGNLVLSGQKLNNQLGGSITTVKNFDLLITGQLDNKGTINSAGTLTFDQAAAKLVNGGQIISGGRALIVASEVNNDGGQISTGAGSGADLTLISQRLSNQSGRMLADGDLTITTHSMLGSGELSSGRDLALSMDGDYVQADGAQPIHANRDLSLTVTGNISNAATFEAVRNLTLTGNRITNQAGALIQAQGVTLNASGDLDNAGEINGAVALSLTSGNTINNSNGIVGGSVMLAAPSLNNSGPTGLLGASRNMALLISNQINNTAGATIYSTGDLVVAGNAGGAGTSVVNNISSTIEAAANLTLVADTVNNVRENVVLTHVTTLDETTHMSLPSWYTHGDNHNYYDPASSNYQPHESYFVNRADILENTTYVTPDGYTIGRAVIRTHANDSAFFAAASGLYSSYGDRERIAVADGTRVLYYTSRSDNVANPDQGGAATNAYPFTETISNWNSAGPTFSSQYGSCGTDCVRFVTQPGYVDPATTIQRDNVHAVAPVWQKLEVSRDAHHLVTEDRLAPGAGAPAQILAGGNMHLTVSQALTNQYGSIMASGFLTSDGAAVQTNQGATLYRTHSFDGTWRTEDGTTVAYTMPSLSEVAGKILGIIDGNQGVSITGRSFSNIDVTAGTVGNILDSINVIGSGAYGPGPVAGGASATGAINSVRSILDASQSGASNTASARRALANGGGAGSTQPVPVAPIKGDPGKGSGGAVEIVPGGLFIKNPDANGKYLYETRPEFADHGNWITSDYLLDGLSVAPAATQKRLGDGFYEQRLVREQLGELTGRAPAAGQSDDSVYQQLLTSAVSFAKQYGLRPGIALSAEQMGHLTSNIVWMENQLVRLPDGSTQTVLVPKVYLAPGRSRATQPGAALVSGASVDIRTDEGIVNRGGVIDAGKGAAVLVSNQDIVNQGGSIRGGAVLLAAARDVRNESLAITQSYASSQTSGSYTSLSNQAVITAGGLLQISAGRDLIDVAGTVGAGSANVSAARDVSLGTLQTGSTYKSQVAGYTETDSAVTHQLSQLNTAGNLVVGAGRDISVSGAQAVMGGSAVLLAGRAVNISSVTNEVNTDQHNDAASKVYDKQIHQNETVVGAALGAVGTVQLTAGATQKAALDISGSSVTGNGAVVLNASGDVNIRGVQEQHVSDTASHRESSGFLKSSSSSRADYSATSNVVGSSVSGGSVAVKSDNDINISGSDVTAQKALTLVAARDLIVASAQQTDTDQHSSEQKKTGFSFNRTEGLNFSKAQQQQDSSSQ